MTTPATVAVGSARISARSTTDDDRLERLIALLETLSQVLDDETNAVRRRD